MEEQQQQEQFFCQQPFFDHSVDEYFDDCEELKPKQYQVSLESRVPSDSNSRRGSGLSQDGFFQISQNPKNPNFLASKFKQTLIYKNQHQNLEEEQRIQSQQELQEQQEYSQDEEEEKLYQQISQVQQGRSDQPGINQLLSNNQQQEQQAETETESEAGLELFETCQFEESSEFSVTPNTNSSNYQEQLQQQEENLQNLSLSHTNSLEQQITTTEENTQNLEFKTYQQQQITMQYNAQIHDSSYNVEDSTDLINNFNFTQNSGEQFEEEEIVQENQQFEQEPEYYQFKYNYLQSVAWNPEGLSDKARRNTPRFCKTYFNLACKTVKHDNKFFEKVYKQAGLPQSDRYKKEFKKQVIQFQNDFLGTKNKSQQFLNYFEFNLLFSSRDEFFQHISKKCFEQINFFKQMVKLYILDTDKILKYFTKRGKKNTKKNQEQNIDKQQFLDMLFYVVDMITNLNGFINSQRYNDYQRMVGNAEKKADRTKLIDYLENYF